MNEAQPIQNGGQSQRTERWVGVFVMLAVLLLLTGFGYHLYHTAQRKGWLLPRAPYFTLLQSAEGLSIGDPITMMGFNIGEITTITAEPPASDNRVFIGFTIRQPYYGYIWTDSKVLVTASGLLGGRRLEVTPGKIGGATVFEANNQITELWIHDHRVAFDKVQKGVHLQPDEDAALTARAEKLLGQLEVALPNILALTNRLNAVLDNTGSLLTNSTALVANLNQTTTQLAPTISNAAIITANLRDVTGNLRDPHGALGEWLLPVDLHTNLNTALITLTTGLNDTLLNLAALTGSLSSQVQSNDQMLAGISKLVVDTDNLVQGLKKHWLLRSAFPAPRAGTNAPPKSVR